MERRMEKPVPAARAAGLLGVCILLLAGCDELSSPASLAKPQSDPPEYAEAFALRGRSEAAAQSALSVLQTIHTPEGFETQIPVFKEHMDEMLSTGERLVDLMNLLDAPRREELNRRLLEGSTMRATMQAISDEMKRVCTIQGVSMPVAMDFASYVFQLERRANRLSTRSRAQASPPRKPAIEGPNCVKITLKGAGDANHRAVLDRIGKFNSGAWQAGGNVLRLEDVRDLEGLIAAIGEQVGVVEKADRQKREILVVVDAQKIPVVDHSERLSELAREHGLPPGFGEDGFDPGGFGPGGFGPGGFGSGPSPGAEVSASNPFEPRSEPANPFDGGAEPVGVPQPEDLVRALKSGDFFQQREALEKLASFDSSEVSAETRKTVAVALKEAAFDEQLEEGARSRAVEGMVAWAGKYAAPQLVPLLENSGGDVGLRRLHVAVLRCLGELKHPDTLEPVVLAFAKRSIDGEAAAECLIQFGPAAEDLVLKHCRPGDAMHSRHVVHVLSKIGTRKSLAALEALSKAREGLMLRGEIAQAAGEIRLRQQGEKTGE